MADRPAADSDVLAVVGPTTDITAEAVVGRYEKARLAVVVVSPVAGTNRIRDAAPVAGASVTVHGVEATADTFAPPASPLARAAVA
ncbi:hypothetical protein ACTU45_34660, partial [Streptomyces sp. 24-1644]